MRPGHPQLPVIRAALIAVLVLLVTSACGSEDPPEGPLGKSSESPSESPTAAAPTPPPKPDATDDEAGRKAFANWFVQAFAYAFATNDPTPITEVGATEKRVQCGTCSSFAAYLADARPRAWPSSPPRSG